MARVRWVMVLLAIGGCTEQRLELEQEKAKNRALEQQVQMMQLQLDQLRKQLDERKAAPPVEKSAGGDEKAMQDAQDAYVQGEYKKAIELAIDLAVKKHAQEEHRTAPRIEEKRPRTL